MGQFTHEASSNSVTDSICFSFKGEASHTQWLLTAFHGHPAGDTPGGMSEEGGRPVAGEPGHSPYATVEPFRSSFFHPVSCVLLGERAAAESTDL